MRFCWQRFSAWADTVGDDWRNSGEVVASGTIPHEDASVDVFGHGGRKQRSLLLGRTGQILFDSVPFPMTIPDAQEYFNDISFDDMDGDGESDVSLSFVYPAGESTSLIWIWAPEERYVFQSVIFRRVDDTAPSISMAFAWIAIVR